MSCSVQAPTWAVWNILVKSVPALWNLAIMLTMENCWEWISLWGHICMNYVHYDLFTTKAYGAMWKCWIVPYAYWTSLYFSFCLRYCICTVYMVRNKKKKKKNSNRDEEYTHPVITAFVCFFIRFCFFHSLVLNLLKCLQSHYTFCFRYCSMYSINGM